MLEQKNKHLICVVYDGIENSVFQSQVLHPLLNDIKEQPNLEVTLVSFEQKRIPNNKLITIIPAHEKLHFIMCRKLPFVGKTSLRFAAYQFKKLLATISCDAIIARGPLAGLVARYALHRLGRIHQIHLIIQARGLCAQEYRYIHKSTQESFFKRHLHALIYKRLESVEQEVFGCAENSIAIEAVSPALKAYLADHFKARVSQITIASRDLPKTIGKEQIAAWRSQVRQKLGIVPDAIVYCYSGSYKPWQCAGESVAYFVEQYKKDPKSFMLVLSHDTKAFIHELEKSGVPKTQYIVMSVAAPALCSYLAAADFGLLLRESDIINWVSRPTKMLEYEAVGLKIVHNNTVAWLHDKSRS